MHVVFSLTGTEDFDPYPVSQIMGVRPEMCWRKGVSGHGHSRRWSCWSYAVGRELDLELDDLLVEMRDLLLPRAAQLGEFHAELQIGVYSNSDTFPGAEISVDHLRWIVDLGASIDVGSV